jgi:hypothetical protein
MDILVLRLHWHVDGGTQVRRGILMERGRELEPKRESKDEMNLHG